MIIRNWISYIRKWLKKERGDDMTRRFTEEELAIAKTADLTAIATSLGYTVQKIGRYHTLKEMDSIRIYDRKNWFRWSRQQEKGNNGGSQIDFLRVFCGMDVKEAVFWLLNFIGHTHQENETLTKALIYQKEKTEFSKKEFILPEKSIDNRYLYSYLMNERALSKEVVDYFVNKGLIYEEKNHHNIVFKGNDKTGVTRFASMRGVFDSKGKAFKCDVAGNDKCYGFNVVKVESRELLVFEGTIDVMSYVDIAQDYDSNLLALGMLADAPLQTFLREYPQIQQIKFCLDNDVPGKKTTEVLLQKYYELGFEVENRSPPEAYKDYNEWLQKTKEVLRKEQNMSGFKNRHLSL